MSNGEEEWHQYLEGIKPGLGKYASACNSFDVVDDMKNHPREVLEQQLRPILENAGARVMEITKLFDSICESKPPPAPLCKFGCGCAPAPGTTPKGNPYDTCCRSCAVSRGGGTHDANCPGRSGGSQGQGNNQSQGQGQGHNGTIFRAQGGSMCKMGCNRPVRQGLYKTGRPYTTCCKKCVDTSGRGHEQNCGQLLEYTMYHDTDRASAQSIQTNGFRRSTDGALGAGVYCSRDIQKTFPYLKGGTGNSAILHLKVTLSSVKRIDRQGDPMQKTWQANGYDAAYAPPGAVGQREEDCVYNLSCIQIIKVEWK